MPRRYSDGEIIKLIRQGRDGLSKGMEVLYHQYGPKIFPYIENKMRNHEEAKDVFQDVLLNLTENIFDQKFKGNSAIYTYLFSIARNLCFKRLHGESKFDPTPPPDEPAADTPETTFLSQEMAEVVQLAINKLKPQYREVLSLWILKYSMQEIADKLEYSSPTVARVTKSRALKELAKVISQDPDLRKMIDEIYN